MPPHPEQRKQHTQCQQHHDTAEACWRSHSWLFVSVADGPRGMQPLVLSNPQASTSGFVTVPCTLHCSFWGSLGEGDSHQLAEHGAIRMSSPAGGPRQSLASKTRLSPLSQEWPSARTKNALQCRTCWAYRDMSASNRVLTLLTWCIAGCNAGGAVHWPVSARRPNTILDSEGRLISAGWSTAIAAQAGKQAGRKESGRRSCRHAHISVLTRAWPAMHAMHAMLVARSNVKTQHILRGGAAELN